MAVGAWIQSERGSDTQILSRRDGRFKTAARRMAAGQSRAL